MNARLTMSMLLLVAVTAGLAPGANAQEGLALPRTDGIQPAAVVEVGSELDPEQFGSEWFMKIIPGSNFIGTDSTRTISYVANGYFTAAAGSSFWAPIDLPPGSEVSSVCVFAYDASASESLSMDWAIYHMGDSTGNPSTQAVASNNTGVAATPGYTLLCAGPGPDSPYLIRAYADVDGDGTLDYNWHRVRIQMTSPDAAIRWGGAYVKWRRAMIPAPVTATFPNDVPTSHPFFRFIEALAASGITAGCGTGSYCPDQPLTRGQMAVFLSAGLGLYWPW
jgi:hypothetical protein